MKFCCLLQTTQIPLIKCLDMTKLVSVHLTCLLTYLFVYKCAKKHFESV